MSLGARTACLGAASANRPTPPPSVDKQVRVSVQKSGALAGQVMRLFLSAGRPFEQETATDGHWRLRVRLSHNDEARETQTEWPASRVITSNRQAEDACCCCCCPTAASTTAAHGHSGDHEVDS